MRKTVVLLCSVVALSVCGGLVMAQIGPPEKYGQCDDPEVVVGDCQVQAGLCYNVQIGVCDNTSMRCPDNTRMESGMALEARAVGLCEGEVGNCSKCAKLYCINGLLFELEDCDGDTCAVSYSSPNKCNPAVMLAVSF